MTKIYVTKYALTAGVLETDARVDGRMAIYKASGTSGDQFAFGKDFHLTEEDALSDCERRRKAKLESLEKQHKKIESMKFKIKGGEE